MKLITDNLCSLAGASIHCLFYQNTYTLTDCKISAVTVKELFSNRSDGNFPDFRL